MVSFKLKDGKFVPRTEEEEQRLEEYFAGTTKPKQTPKKRGEPFIQVTMKQLDLLIPTLSKSPEVSIFFVLCHESFRHRGAPFVWPAEQLARIGGLNLRTQRRAANLLEKVGLISLQRRHRKPPIVRVLTAT